MFPSTRDVVRALITYTDWWQPPTGSVLQVGAARRGSGYSDGIRDGLLDTIGERTELAYRVRERLDDLDRQILLLWYVRELPAHEIARAVKVSRRTCFRRRSAALRRLIDDDAQGDVA